MTSRRVGLIGYGDVSVVHLEAIREAPGLELVGVADTDPAARARAAQETGVTAVATTAELLERARPDAVHVTTPHDQHIRDRKSTRLNSSHVAISYAVF